MRRIFSSRMGTDSLQVRLRALSRLLPSLARGAITMWFGPPVRATRPAD